jgi:hypothetical protein
MDAAPPEADGRRFGVMPSPGELPNLDADPLSQEPTAVVVMTEAAQREADEQARAHYTSVPVRTGFSAAGAPFRAAFLLSHVDGTTTVEEIAKTSQIPVIEAARTFVLLAADGVVELQPKS